MNCENCDDILDRLWEYLDQELDEERIAEMRAHLERCTACHDQAEVTRAFLAMLPETPVPDDELGRVRSRILDALAREGLG